MKLLRSFFAVLLALAFFAAAPASAHVLTLNYASTNVTTSAYVTLTSSAPTSASKLLVCDTSGQFVKIATGEPGSEHDVFAVGFDALVSSCIVVPYYIKKGDRIALKAAITNITSGYLVLSLIE